MVSKDHMKYLLIIFLVIGIGIVLTNKDIVTSNQTDISDSPNNEFVTVNETQPVLTELEKPESLCSNVKSYEVIYDFPSDMVFADKESLEQIKNYYSKIEFGGEFKKGDLSVYDYYKRKYRELMEKDEIIYDLDGRTLFFSTLYELGKEKFVFYLFDMDEDDAPELCLTGTHGTYIIKYDVNKNQYHIWWGYLHSGGTILGSRKIGFSYTGSDFYFFQLDKEGVLEYSVAFVPISDNFGNTSYLVTLPKFKDGATDLQLLETMNQVYYSEANSRYYIRVTKEQMEDLHQAYYDAEIRAVKERMELSDFYNE